MHVSVRRAKRVDEKVHFITAEKGGVTRAEDKGEKEKECIRECKRQRRLDDKAPWALKLRERGGREEERRRDACDACVRPMATELPSVWMLMRRAAAIAKMRLTFP